jgi:hypothetical protein
MTAKPQETPAPPQDSITLERFLAKSATAELRWAGQQFDTWRRQLQQLRDTAARIVSECDSVLAGKPWPEEEPF